MGEMADVLAEVRKLPYSRRYLFFDLLRQQVSDRHFNGERLIEWPDILLMIQPGDFQEALDSIKGGLCHD